MKQNIQTLAARDGNPKLKKADVQDYIERLYTDRNSLDDEELARIYRFFMPTLPKIAKTDFQWLWKSVFKKETLPHLKYIWCDGENAVATNGISMHVVPCNNSEGFYDQNGVQIEWDYAFPQYKRLLNFKDRTDEKTVKISDLKLTKSKLNTVCYEISGALFNKTFVDASVNGEKEITFYPSLAGGPMFIKFEKGRLALIMTIQD